MEQMQLTPSSPSTSSHKTPSKQGDRKERYATYTNANGFTLLSNHLTPPSGLTKFIARNPFDADLTSRLHLSVISPTIFSKVSPKSQDSPAFSWTIDELAIMTPVKIDEFPLQQSHCSDPDVELHAQKAIDKFFSESQIHPSPWNAKKEPMVPLVMLTPTRPTNALSISRESQKGTKDCETQTVLTLPPELPKDLEEALKPYFTYNQEKNVENDDANSSNNSLRRKLFFNHDESTEEETECSFTLSPLKGTSSPPQSGMFVHGTPLRGGSLCLQRTHGTPYRNSGNLSPPNVSPICTPAHDMSCQSIRLRRRSATRLDFTTFMSIDTSAEEKDFNEPEELPISAPKMEMSIQIESERVAENNNDTIEMVSLLQEATPFKQITDKHDEVTDKVKETIEWYKSVSEESVSGYKHGNTLIRSNYSEQSSAFNFAQDTGYQTYSMNSTDNRSITPIKKAFNWGEKVSTLHNDDVKTSNWQENIKHMYSSTPSKYARQRDD